MNRYRILYEKLETLRYTGNLDVHRLWERTFRRAGLALSYTQGFHPQPRFQQAFPLPLGFTSRCSMIDVWLDDELSIEEIGQLLNLVMHPGIQILEIEEVDLKLPALQTLVTASEYRLHFRDAFLAEALQAKIEVILASCEILREKRGKKYDLRPLILALSLEKEATGKPNALFLRLSALPGATGRPEEVLAELNIGIGSVKMEHTQILFQ
jgi:radical SAM-linked protein